MMSFCVSKDIFKKSSEVIREGDCKTDNLMINNNLHYNMQVCNQISKEVVSHRQPLV